MQRTYAAGVTFHDPEGTVTGHEALEAKVEALYAGPPGLGFPGGRSGSRGG
jgi:hypothetical protein